MRRGLPKPRQNPRFQRAHLRDHAAAERHDGDRLPAAGLLGEGTQEGCLGLRNRVRLLTLQRPACQIP